MLHGQMCPFLSWGVWGLAGWLWAPIRGGGVAREGLDEPVLLFPIIPLPSVCCTFEALFI